MTGGKRWRVWAWSGFAFALLTVFYTLAGFYLAPRLIRSQATAWAQTNLDKKLGLGEIRFNPFTFTLDIDDIEMPEGGLPMVAVGHLRVSFSIFSLFQHAYFFREVRLERPFLHLVVRPDHSLNLADLLPRTQSADQPPPTQSSGPSPAIRVGSLAIAQGKVVYTDQSQAQPPERTLAPIGFTLVDFETEGAKGGTFSFDAQSERGEKFAWQGDLAIAPLSSHGQLTVTGLQAASIQQLAGEYLPVALAGGEIGLNLQYDFAVGQEGPRLDMTAPSLTLTNLAVDGKHIFPGTINLENLSSGIGRLKFVANAKGIAALGVDIPQSTLRGLRIAASTGTGQAIGLAQAALKDVALDYSARKLTAGGLTLSGVDLPLLRARDGRLSVMDLLPQSASQASVSQPPAPPAPAPAAPQATTPGWAFALAAFTLDNATLRLEDQAVTPAAHITVAPIALSLTGASSNLDAPVPFQFDAKVNDRAAVGIQGSIVPARMTADVNFKLADFALAPLAAYVSLPPALKMKSGTASASGTLHVEGDNPQMARFDGAAAVNDFGVFDAAGKNQLVGWRGFSLDGIDYRGGTLTIARAKLSQPVGGVAVLAGGRFNFQSVSTPTAPKTRTAVRAHPAATPHPHNKPAPALAFRVKRLDIADGTMSFADYSIRPNFQARVSALKGTVSNISSGPREVATINLSGQVIDRYSPVTIDGKVAPLGYDQNTDLRLAFHNIELPVFNPYSGRYAGYAIAKGKLTTEFSYKIVRRALQADHHVVVDQLEWGQATDSKDAVPLPVRLATALLKDKNGVIDLDLPVTGSLDDPKFSIWPIVWKVVGNIIEKAVTAPFRAIGALFAGADQAQFVDFTPGSAALPAGSGDALGAFSKALTDRPELQLDIPAAPGIREDANALADAAIDAQAMGDSAPKGGFAALDADDQHDDLERLYKKKLGKKPAYPDYTPDALKAVSDKADLDDDSRRQLLESAWLRDQLRIALAPSNDELAALGQARAKAIRDALLAAGSVDPARLFLAGDLAAAADAGHSRVELKIK
jgi:uncharacterized protein involved in outer membrane biogenesis